MRNESHYSNETQRIYAAQVNRLYQHIPIGITGTLANSIILVYILWKVIDHSVLIIWLLAGVLVSLIRYLLLRGYRRSSTTSSEVNRWSFWFIFSMVLTGIYFGSAAVFLFPAESVGHQAFIAFAQGGMVAGSVGTFSVLMYAFLAYSLPCLIPIIFRFLFMGGEIHTAMGIMVILFLVLMIFAARHINSEAVSSLGLAFENIDLVNNLTVEKENVEELNENLKSEIVQRKEVEEALRDSEERYRNLFNNAQVGLYRTRISDGKFVEANDALAGMFGYEDSADILDAEYITADNYVDPGTREKLLAILREHGEFRNFEARLYRKDRSAAWFRYSGRIYPEKGYIEGVAADITEEKRLEKRLLQSQKMEAVGTLAGGVAHDLNNILSGLVGYPELLLLDIPEDSPLRKPILTIQDSGQKAAVIVQDLLTLARRGVAITEVVNLNDIVYDHLESPEHEKLKSFHSGVEFEINLAPDLLNILGSPVHLSKTIMNLLSNAAEAMPDASIITMSTSNQYLDRPVRGYEDVQEGDYIVLSVVDSGVGMSEEDLARIFEPFYTKKVMGRSGTGLGMAVVWGTVKDHKGYIDIESSEGKGTTFTLYFPVTRKEIAKDESLVSIEDYMGKGESVLIVDDVEKQRELASKMLNRLGYSANTVSSGKEAVDYLKNNSADLLVLDMIMDPGIDGLDTYKKILELHPGQKAIIASGFSETERVKEAQKLGAGQYINKPYTLENIGLAIKNELKLKK